MNYFIDTEFLEGTQKRMFGETKPTIDLISIGIVREDGREYYAISKDFNLKEAWNRYDLKRKENIISKDVKKENGATIYSTQTNVTMYKDYWIRDNVLKPIYDQFISGDTKNKYQFTYKTMKWLINNFGKTNKQIATDIKMFVALKDLDCGFNTRLPLDDSNAEYHNRMTNLIAQNERYKPKFYGYYCDYDWVAFCWLFGKMIDLPKYFPMYCIDLKQMLDVKYKDGYYYMNYIPVDDTYPSIIKSGRIDKVEKHPDYPKQTNEHSAIHDARWNFELYKFLTDTQWI